MKNLFCTFLKKHSSHHLVWRDIPRAEIPEEKDIKIEPVVLKDDLEEKFNQMKSDMENMVADEKITARYIYDELFHKTLGATDGPLNNPIQRGLRVLEGIEGASDFADEESASYLSGENYATLKSKNPGKSDEEMGVKYYRGGDKNFSRKDIFLHDHVDVLVLQTILKKMHFDPGTLDGVWGNKTKAAVTAFQRRYNEIYTDEKITVDGEFGDQTFEAIGRYIVQAHGDAAPPTSEDEPDTEPKKTVEEVEEKDSDEASEVTPEAEFEKTLENEAQKATFRKLINTGAWEEKAIRVAPDKKSLSIHIDLPEFPIRDFVIEKNGTVSVFYEVPPDTSKLRASGELPTTPEALAKITGESLKEKIRKLGETFKKHRQEEQAKKKPSDGGVDTTDTTESTEKKDERTFLNTLNSLQKTTFSRLKKTTAWQEKIIQVDPTSPKNLEYQFPEDVVEKYIEITINPTVPNRINVTWWTMTYTTDGRAEDNKAGVHIDLPETDAALTKITGEYIAGIVRTEEKRIIDKYAPKPEPKDPADGTTKREEERGILDDDGEWTKGVGTETMKDLEEEEEKGEPSLGEGGRTVESAKFTEGQLQTVEILKKHSLFTEKIIKYISGKLQYEGSTAKFHDVIPGDKTFIGQIMIVGREGKRKYSVIVPLSNLNKANKEWINKELEKARREELNLPVLPESY